MEATMPTATVFRRLTEIPTAEELSQKSPEELNELLNRADTIRDKFTTNGWMNDFNDFSLKEDVKLINRAKKLQAPSPQLG